jgi:hypothetical protein
MITMAKGKKTGGGRPALSIVGIAVAVIGVIALLYAAYTAFGMHPGFTRRYQANATALPGVPGPNQSRFGAGGVGADGFGFIPQGAELAAIGILMVLLGIVTYKYSLLKARL